MKRLKETKLLLAKWAPMVTYAFGGSCALGATQLMTTLFPLGGALF